MTNPPAAKKPRLVGRSSFGTKKELSDAQLMRFEIHDFESLPHKRGQSIELPPLKAHGYSWSLRVYPRGCNRSDEQTEYVSIFLERVCSDATDLTVLYSVKCASIDRIIKKPHCFSSASFTWGWSDFAKRDKILDPAKHCLDKDGTLTFDVSLQIYRERKPTVSFPVWFPPGHQPCDMISRLWMSHEFADVTFLIGNESVPAHKFILAASAATLFDMVKDESSREAVAITGVQVDVFKAMVQFIYTGELAKLDFVDGGEIDAKALLVTADRFGCTKLKLRVESEVTAYVLGKNNAAEWLLVADSHSCALLKEACVNMFVNHSSAVMESSEWPKVEESRALLLELMRAQNLAKNKSNNDDGNDDIDCMDVSSLRERLQAAGLDVDGSREMLVSRLKNHLAGDDDEEECD